MLHTVLGGHKDCSAADELVLFLFLGSNPSFAEVEKYPRRTWSDEKIDDFFTHRFQDRDRPWVKNGLYVLTTDGTYAQGWVRYWAAVRRRAAELLPGQTVRPGIDYTMSEVVHCKSRREGGVGEAAEECAKRYLCRLIEESGASVIVSLGRFAADCRLKSLQP